MRIFISYSKRDTSALAQQLRDQLCKQIPDLVVWMDEELLPTDAWSAQIEHEIDRCDLMIVLLSPDVNRPRTEQQNRSFVLKEIHYANERFKPIVTVMAQHTKVPLILAGDEYIDLTSDQHKGVGRLTQYIQRRLENQNPEQTDSSSQTNDAPLPPIHRHTILIVDDNEETSQAVSELLHYEEFDTVITHTGSEAIDYLSANSASLILLDINLPDMDGWQTCSAIQEMTDTPIIFFTGLRDHKAMVKALSLGVVDYITKPYSSAELIARIRAKIRRPDIEVKRLYPRILIVEDMKVLAEDIRHMLEVTGYEAITAYSGEAGLQKAYEHQPDLVLLDIMMPYMTGYELCRRLREISDVPIIFLTAKDELSDIIVGLEIGGDDYISKPFNADELLARIQVNLKRKARG